MKCQVPYSVQCCTLIRFCHFSPIKPDFSPEGATASLLNTTPIILASSHIQFLPFGSSVVSTSSHVAKLSAHCSKKTPPQVHTAVFLRIATNGHFSTTEMPKE